jgi:hypothetical protein
MAVAAGVALLSAVAVSRLSACAMGLPGDVKAHRDEKSPSRPRGASAIDPEDRKLCTYWPSRLPLSRPIIGMALGLSSPAMACGAVKVGSCIAAAELVW